MKTITREQLQKWMKKLFDNIASSVATPYRKFSTLFLSAVFLCFMILSSNPSFSIQMLSAGPSFWPTALMTRLYGLLASSGYPGFALTAAVAVLAAATATNFGVNVYSRNLDISGLATVPAFLVGGCASCGVGILGFLGFGGVLASLPIQGNGIRLGTAALLLALMARTGKPGSCRV